MPRRRVEGRITSLPNLLSLVRLGLLPGFALALVHQRPTLALGVLALMALTDALDGHLARRWHQVSTLGKILDHVIDKVIILTTTLLLIRYRDLPAWVFWLILTREVLTILATAYMFYRHGVMGQSSKLGRATGVAMAVTLVFYLFEWPYRTGLLYTTLSLALLASLNYLRLYARWLPGLDQRPHP